MFRVTYRKTNGVEGVFECRSEHRLELLLNWLMDEKLEMLQVSNLDVEKTEPHWFY